MYIYIYVPQSPLQSPCPSQALRIALGPTPAVAVAHCDSGCPSPSPRGQPQAPRGEGIYLPSRMMGSGVTQSYVEMGQSGGSVGTRFLHRSL